MNLFKTSILSGISTLIKILSGLVINKLVAIYIGPTGIALIGQFQNVLLMLTTAGTGAINSGVTKYVAEYQDDIDRRNQIIKISLVITMVCSIIVGIGILLFNEALTLIVFKTLEYKVVFYVLGFTLIFSSLNLFLLSVLNGLKKIKLFILANIIGSIASLIITSFLTITFQLYGALISSVLIQSIVLFITIPICIKNGIFKSISFHQSIDKLVVKKLLNYSLMTIVTMVMLPISQILIRSYIIDKLSIEEAGYWQAVWKISELYLMVITTAFATYYLPRLSELKKNEEIRKEIIAGYKLIVPFVLFCSIGIYILRDFIIWFLFTSEFKEMKSLFTFQLIGDFLKMCSWILSYLMVAKAMTKTFIITEIIFTSLFYLFSIWFLNLFGIIGVTYAHALNYLLYFFTMIILFKNILFLKKESSNA